MTCSTAHLGLVTAAPARLSLARQWCAEQQGIKLHEDGLYGMKRIDVFSGTMHSSALKCLSMLGMGRKSWQALKLLADREAIDLDDLEAKLRQKNGVPCIVVDHRFA